MSSDISLEQHSSTEESNQLTRSVKKHIWDEDLVTDSTHNNMARGEDVILGTRPSFADAFQGKMQRLEIYTRKGEDDITDDLNIADVIQPLSTDHGGLTGLIVDIPWNEYQEFWKPWCRALILKVLGKSISFKVLEPRIKRIWQLEHGCEIIDLEQGYL